jgi:hypothetical protein
MTWFKFLAAGAVGPFSGWPWPQPTTTGLGGWAVAAPPYDPCRHGLHLCRVADLPLWLHEELYVVEAAGPVEEQDTFVLAGQARLTARVREWGPDAAAGLAADCAWRVRDLAVAALRDDGHRGEADRLADSDALGDLPGLAAAPAEGTPRVARLAGCAGDAATYATLASAERGWASACATAGYIAAVAALVAAPADGAATAVAAERDRQARWLERRLLADR